MRYIPAWFPGAGFKRTAASWRENLLETTEKPYRLVLQQMAQGMYPASYLSKLLEESQDRQLTPKEEQVIKFSTASLYAGGVDTVRPPTRPQAWITINCQLTDGHRPSQPYPASSLQWLYTQTFRKRPKKNSTVSLDRINSPPSPTGLNCPILKPWSTSPSGGIPSPQWVSHICAPKTIFMRDTSYRKDL